MIEMRLALPQRSPKPVDGALHLGGADAHRAMVLATATSESLWQWIAIGHLTAPSAARTASSISAGSRPPLVSHRQIGIGAGLVDGADAVHRVFAIV